MTNRLEFYSLLRMRFCFVWLFLAMAACGGGSTNTDAALTDAPISDSAPVEISPTLSTVVLSTNFAEVGATTITANIEVRDRAGLPVANWPVQVSTTNAADTLSPVANTDRDGKTEVVWQTTLAGARRLSVNLGDVMLNTAEATWRAGPPAQLRFGALPASWVAGVLSPGVEISVQDTFGNLAVTPQRTFVISLTSNPAFQQSFSLAGSAVTLNGLAITAPGTGYRFRVVSLDQQIAASESTSFDILAAPPTVTSTFRRISDTEIVADDDQETEVSMRLVDRSFAPLVNYPVTITVTGLGNTIITPGVTSDRGIYRARLRSSVAELKTVTMSAGSITQSYDVAFVAKPCTPKFDSRELFNASFATQPFVAGDFNGDTILDYAHVAPWYAGSDWDAAPFSAELVVRFGLGGGRFRTSATTIPFFGRFETTLTARDFNGDGRIDLLLSGNDRFIVMLGAGDGTFPTLRESPLSASSSVIYIGDFTGDGNLDILGYGNTGRTPYLAIFQGFGDGKFAIGRIIRPSSTINSLTSVSVADLDVDGKLDLVGVDNNQLVVLRGRGDGTFLPAQLRTDLALRNVYVADVNRNGAPDLLAIDGNTARIALGNRNGTFGAFATLDAFTPTNVRMIDLNGDNTPDIFGEQTMFGRGDGTFQAPVELGIPSDGLVFDWDNDGDIDVLGQTLFENAGAGAFAVAKRLDTASNMGTSELLACSGDYNADGVPDLVATDFAGISVFQMARPGAIVARITTSVANVSSAFSIAADFNHDNKLDAVIGGDVFLGTGDGAFVQGPSTNKVGGYFTTKADFNGDGNVDLAWLGFDKIVRYALGASDGRFGMPTAIRTAGSVQLDISGLSVADVNEDGAIDLVGVTYNNTESDILYWQNTAGALTEFATLTPLPALGLGAAAGDFNNDGHIDVAALTTETFCFLPGGGAAGFGALHCANRTGGLSSRLEAVDLDRNGTLDLVGRTDNGMTYYQGFGDGMFRRARRFMGFQPLLFDYNQDQKLDLVWGRSRYDHSPPAFFVSLQQACLVE